MATEPTLRDRLEAVRSLRKLATALAADQRSTKDMEAWRRALTRWKAGGGIDEENAIILADHLNTTADKIISSPERRAQAELLEAEERFDRIEAQIEAIRAHIEALAAQVTELLADPPARAGNGRDGQ